MREFFNVLRYATVELPAIEVAIVIATLSICLGLRWRHVGLIIAYIFVYRWGWLFFTRHHPTFFIAYLVFGTLVAGLAVVGMVSSKRQH